ncbi:RNA polymerase sigma factor [Paenibacillus faecalis]|uniref:RNA polymerase sigma factor n=1 Tax=Paenibacillus faecalis TaxID=2079532 RepID=UPI001F431CC5|nr:sigma-70 family RNA polymerase sigma factor [Paenibacillus faecalis]
MSKSDNEILCLLEEMKNGSITAFDRFYIRYAPFVLQIALRTMKDQMEAEDVCHDVFLEILRKADQYNPSRGSLEAWLAVMTRSRCMDRLRKKQRTTADELSESVESAISYRSSGALVEESVLANLQNEAIREALQLIPKKQSEVVTEVYFGSRTHREVSAERQIPLGTVKSLVRYGLNNLHKQLTSLGWIDKKKKVIRHD